MAKKRILETELVYGIHPIIELLKAKKRRIAILYTTKPEPKNWKSIATLLPKGTQIQYVARETLHQLAQTTDHQGIVAYASSFQFQSIIDAQKYPFLLLLDGIQDSRNLGAIIRSAYCTNTSGIIITQKGSAPLNAAALKASAGLAEYISMMQVPSASNAVQMLLKQHYHMYISTINAPQKAHEINYKLPLCLVIGNEEKGVSSDILKSGTLITLPQKRTDISYNASVAAGILLFTIATQQRTI